MEKSIAKSELEFLIKQYYSNLNEFLRNESFPFNLINPCKNKLIDNYYRSMYFSYCRLLKLENKPLYNSRQEFLYNHFIDEDGEIIYNPIIIESNRTCMGGSKDDDEFYDPNWITTIYSYKNKIYTRIIKNLKVNFFVGVKNGWQYFNNKKEYISSMDLEPISIKDFNNLLIPKFDSQNFDSDFEIHKNEMYNKVKSLIDSSSFVKEFEENSEEKDFEYSNKSNSEEKNLRTNYNQLYFDENSNQIEERAYNICFNSRIKIGSLLFFGSGIRTVTDIKIINQKEKGHYLEIYTEPSDLKYSYLIGS